MARYFFHTHDGRDIPDDIGDELETDELAKIEAVRAAGEQLRDLGAHFWKSGEWAMHVQREDGETVCRLAFSVRDG